MVDEVKQEEVEEVKVSEEEILFPEVKVGEVTIKPWSFGILFDISSSLESILNKMEKQGLIQEFEKNTNFLSYSTLARLFTIASSEVLKVIAVTLGKEEKDVKAFDMETGLKVAFIIYKQNKITITNSIKNALSPSKK